MSNDVQKFDPSQLMQGVRDRIKATFVSLIPDDRWEQMVKEVYEQFFNVERREYDSNRPIYLTEFQKVVYAVLTEVSREQVLKYIEKFESKIWSDDGMEANDLLKDLITQNANKIFCNTFANMFANAVSKMRY